MANVSKVKVFIPKRYFSDPDLEVKVVETNIDAIEAGQLAGRLFMKYACEDAASALLATALPTELNRWHAVGDHAPAFVFEEGYRRAMQLAREGTTGVPSSKRERCCEYDCKYNLSGWCLVANDTPCP